MLESSVRVMLIALGAAAVLGVFRVKAARVRHNVWAAVVVAMLALPLWIAWGPMAVVRVLPAATVADVKLSARIPETPAEPRQAWLAAIPKSTPGYLTWVYLVGAGIMLARLGLGTLRANWLRRRAVRVEGRLASADCAAPITVGGLHPAVILPANWPAWRTDQLDAVLAHEGEHARWRDPLAQWLAQVNRAVFWFHPLAWWLERRLAALSEEACDAAVLAQTHDAHAYAAFLLEMARAVSRQGARIGILGMAMPGSGLPRRIRRILQEAPTPPATRVQIATVAVACLMLSAVFAAAGVERQIPRLRVLLPELPHAPLAVSRPAARPPVLRAQERTPAAPAPTKEHRQIALVFDFGSMPEVDQTNAKTAALKFVRTQLRSDEVLALVGLFGGTVRVLQDFTSDQDQLLRAIEALTPVSNPDRGQTLSDLQKAVELLGAIEGKKALVFFTTPLPRPDAQLQPIIQAAIRANVAFYPIDSAGLVRYTP
jgi:beta-lactamase regulating signal transducer with metallopeptidase domain